MKSINSKKTHLKRNIITTTLITVALGVSTVYVMSVTKTGPFANQQAGSSNQNIPSANADTDSENIPTTENNKTPLSHQPANNQSNTKQLAATITAANQNVDTLQIRTLIESFTDSGTCKLTLSNGTQTIVRTVSVQATVNASTCRGFDIPLSELSAGEWTITIAISLSTQNTTLTKTITIK